MFAGNNFSRAEKHSVLPGNIETDKCHAPRPAQTQEKLGSKKKSYRFILYTLNLLIRGLRTRDTRTLR